MIDLAARFDAARSWIVAGLALLLYCPLANAALTPINDSLDFYDEPNLIGVNPFPGNLNPSVLETLYGEANLRRVDDREDVAFRHTGAEAIVTPVAYFDASPFALLYVPRATVPASLGPFFGESVTSIVGTPSGYYPAAVSGSISLALSGEVFGLQNHRRLYSDPVYNNSRETDYVVTYEIIGNVGRESNVIGNYVICWDSAENGDRDFQDAVFEISGVVATTSLAADFNGDLTVDATDLAMWRAGYGNPYNVQVQSGDANRDHRVNGADFLIWQRAYSAPASSAAVPEPSTAALLAFVALIVRPRSRTL